jgi:cystathionine gamma-lyase
MAAASAVLLPLLRSGDALVAPADGYPAVRTLATGQLAECGVEVRLVPAAGPPGDAVLEGAKLVWLETPSNPGLETVDVAAVVERAHAAGALVAVDNTLATPLGQLPLALGADFSVASDSKHLSGHGDLILGHVAVSDAGRAEALTSWRTQTGAVPGPFEAWLAHRSLATLELRLERQCATALALAERLLFRDDVADVRYPGLPRDPGHEVARRQMRRFGTVVCFTLDGRERAERFLAACRLVAQATSFGGVHSTAERRGRWGGNDVADGFVRFSVGCETTEDLLEDVERALDLAAG